MTFEQYRSQICALLMAEAADACITIARHATDPAQLYRVLRFHWFIANNVLKCETVGEVRDLMYDEGFKYIGSLHMNNIHTVFPNGYAPLR